MAKKNLYLEGVKAGLKYAHVDLYVEEMFAAMALALTERTTLDEDSITELLTFIQGEWNNAVTQGYDIRERCLEVANIDVRGASTT